MVARITKYLNKCVRMGICLIYMSSFYFWSPSFARKIQKTNMRYYPEYPSGSENIGKSSYYNLPPDIGFILFTPIKGCIDSLTVYIYKAEKCTNILRYNTCMSSYRGDGKCTKIEPFGVNNIKPMSGGRL
jgi:hypothetical protein